MKFVSICVFTLAFFASTLASPTGSYSQSLTELYNRVASSIKPGKCPEARPLSEPFKLEQFLGAWYEIQSTKPIFEKSLRSIQANYQIDQSTGDVIVNNSGINENSELVIATGTAKTTELDNVLAVKFFPLSPSAQYWVADTDYIGYALIVSCNNILGLFHINDAWILSREPTLDSSVIENLKDEYAKLGFDASKLTETPF